MLGGGTAERSMLLSKNFRKNKFRAVNLVTDYGHKGKADSNTVVLPIIFKRFYLPFCNFYRLILFIKKFDYIHLMGHWSILNVFVYLVAVYYKIPYIVCPAGALPVSGRNKFLKTIFNFFIGKKIILNANLKVAISTSEYDAYSSYGVDERDIVLIPNGVDLASTYDPCENHTIFDKLPEDYILFMGRLDQIKGPDLLLEAFIKINSKIPNFNLLYAGTDFGMRRELENRVYKFGLQDRVKFLGYVHGNCKTVLYRAAKLMVIPSRSEAMSIVALEAGLHSLPVLITKTCGFNELSKINALLECDPNIDSIANNLELLLLNIDNLKPIGSLFNNLITKNYGWESIVKKYIREINGI